MIRRERPLSNQPLSIGKHDPLASLETLLTKIVNHDLWILASGAWSTDHGLRSPPALAAETSKVTHAFNLAAVSSSFVGQALL